MTETRNFHAPGLQISDLVHALGDWYRSQGFNVQELDVHGGGVLVQANRGGWRNVVGMSSALNVVLRQTGNDLSVEIGAGKWLDKAAAGAVSVFILWPLAFTAAWGAWQQSQLPKRTFEFIQQCITSGGSNSSYSASPQSSVAATMDTSPTSVATSANQSYRFCPSCGNTVGENDRFCSKCGHTLQ